jgi:hypothetical protein
VDFSSANNKAERSRENPAGQDAPVEAREPPITVEHFRGTVLTYSALIPKENTGFWTPYEGTAGASVLMKRKAFRLSSTLLPMYPVHVTDAVIQTVITELAVGERLPSGALLRAVLKQRYGSPGGVARIYRLLSQAQSKKSVVRTAETAEVLQRELQAMRARAERAEQREETHQTRWAAEVDQLRLKVAAFEPLAQQARKALDDVGLLRRQLQAAEARVATLEQQLIEANGGGEKR